MKKELDSEMYEINGTLINLYDVVELRKEYKEEAFPAYGYYGILVVTIENGKKSEKLRFTIGEKQSSLDDAYRLVDDEMLTIKQLIEKLD
jgi:hypothetical protein